MFDPTAFDNMKIVMEGALYDKDMDGIFEILDRNDLFNSSKLSREYSISFSLKNQQNVIMTFSLNAGLLNLAAELLPEMKKEKEIGCYISLHLLVRHNKEDNIFQSLEKMLKHIWGEDRKIGQEIRMNPFSTDNTIDNHLTLLFNRLITEEHIDDLVRMIDFMEKTLLILNENTKLLPIR
ncbi:hypothetical protein [Niallia sp. 03133]|uniref:hypothetical protein n=1 Tax=Niallia sp. 03133 TaxID=3458060 RepID=UPI004043D946